MDHKIAVSMVSAKQISDPTYESLVACQPHISSANSQLWAKGKTTGVFYAQFACPKRGVKGGCF